MCYKFLKSLLQNSRVLQNFITLGKQNRFKIYEKRGDKEKEEEKCVFFFKV
jgi:hypothetical protein